uniref:Uncharacterized protein n=1 Tax=Mycena chlorophos TaxID=658473 RepID=A0ABQ0LDA4_MYCCL|nr:predicted protein [Mycena chlorophos]
MIIDDDSTKSSSLFQSDQPTTQAGPSEPPPPPYTPNSPHSPSSEAPDLESGGDREKRAKTRRRKHKRRRWIVLGSLLLNVLLFFMLFHVVRRSRGLGHGPPGFVRLPWDREHGRPGKGHPHSHNREADDRNHFGQEVDDRKSFLDVFLVSMRCLRLFPSNTMPSHANELVLGSTGHLAEHFPENKSANISVHPFIVDQAAGASTKPFRRQVDY